MNALATVELSGSAPVFAFSAGRPDAHDRLAAVQGFFSVRFLYETRSALVCWRE